MHTRTVMICFLDDGPQSPTVRFSTNDMDLLECTADTLEPLAREIWLDAVVLVSTSDARLADVSRLLSTCEQPFSILHARAGVEALETTARHFAQLAHAN